MSVREVYRAMMRMLYDPAFALRVRGDGGTALAGADLTPEELGWLAGPDPRAWRTDKLRRWRTLTGLLEEFPVASALVLRRGREGSLRPEPALLEAFFGHPLLHECLARGESLAPAFGRYLQEREHAGVEADPRVAPIARLETVVAQLRRLRAPEVVPATRAGGEAGAVAGVPPPPSGAEGPTPLLRAAPWARILRLPAGAAELHGRITRALSAKGRRPLESLLDPHWSLPVLLEPDPWTVEPVLVERPPVPGEPWADAPVLHAPVTEELAALLEHAATPRARHELAAEARRLGAEAGEEEEILESLERERLLIPAA